MLILKIISFFFLGYGFTGTFKKGDIYEKISICIAVIGLLAMICIYEMKLKLLL